MVAVVLASPSKSTSADQGLRLTEARCHRLDALALAVQEQTAHIHTYPAAFRTTQPRRQLCQKIFQALVQSLQLTRLHPLRMRLASPKLNFYLTECY